LLFKEVVMPSSQITITAPDTAEEGDTVQFSVAVKNISSIIQKFTMECWAPDQAPANKKYDVIATIPPGSTVAWPPATFVMPDYDAEIFVWVERWTGSDYTYDTALIKKVLLVTIGPPEFQGFAIKEYITV
jgi:hypothetical protein